MSAVLQQTRPQPGYSLPVHNPFTGEVPRFVTARVKRMTLTPKGRKVRIELDHTVYVPFANLHKRMVRQASSRGGELVIDNLFSHLGLVSRLAATPLEVADKDIREGDTIFIAVGYAFRPYALGVDLVRRPVNARRFEVRGV